MLDFREERMADHFVKHHIEGLPRAAVIHRFSEIDNGDPHSHPWAFHSFVIAGGYVEEVFDVTDGTSHLVRREPGQSFYISAQHVHRIVELLDGECWTVILPYQYEQESGFYQFRDGQAYYRPWHRPEFEMLAV